MSESETVPFAPLFTGVTFALTFHVRCISTIRFLYFKVYYYYYYRRAMFAMASHEIHSKYFFCGAAAQRRPWPPHS